VVFYQHLNLHSRVNSPCFQGVSSANGNANASDVHTYLRLCSHLHCTCEQAGGLALFIHRTNCLTVVRTAQIRTVLQCVLVLLLNTRTHVQKMGSECECGELGWCARLVLEKPRCQCVTSIFLGEEFSYYTICN